MNDSKILTIKDLFAQYGFTEGQQRKLRKHGLHYCKVGSHIFYNRRRVDAFILQFERVS